MLEAGLALLLYPFPSTRCRLEGPGLLDSARLRFVPLLELDEGSRHALEVAVVIPP